MAKNIVIIGSSGALGQAFVKKLATLYPDATIHAFSSSKPKDIVETVRYHTINYSELSIKHSAALASEKSPIDIIIIANGILHENEIMPEKSLKELSEKKFQRLFEINTILPALIAKHFLPNLSMENHPIFVALSARVGSISDNTLGGWYSYRASKAALNMVLKNAAIEIKRTNKLAIVIGMHPGTVDSHLSQPFQKNIDKSKLFSPEYSVEKLVDVMNKLNPEDSGKCFAWDGKEILP